MSALVDKTFFGQIETSYGIKKELIRYDFLSNKTFFLHISLSSPIVGVAFIRFLFVTLFVVENDRIDEINLNQSLFLKYLSRNGKLKS